MEGNERIEKEDLPRMEHLPLDPIIVPYALDDGVVGLARLQIDTNCVAVRLLLLLRTDSPLSDCPRKQQSGSRIPEAAPTRPGRRIRRWR